jgi:hypothetical protein
MKAHHILISLGTLALLLPLTRASSEAASNCDQMDVSTISSPDGSWMARVYGESCDLQLSSSAAVVVELVRAGSTRFPQVVLGMTMPSSKSGWPKVAWQSQTKLAIDLPSSAEIGLQVAHFQGIDVDVRFCPRDPAERARWLSYRTSYRQWLTDTSAWIEMKKRDPASLVPKPARPAPPSTGISSTCSE